MGPLRVPVADDEEKIRQVIGIYLTNDGYQVGEAADGEEADTHINRLRDKLRAAGAENFIKTVWGVGYKFEVKS